MIFTETSLKGAFIIKPELIEDERGFFARTWCQREFAKIGLDSQLAQCNISFNKEKGTIRGLHYQSAPYEEAKLVRCTNGVVYDVIVDLRLDSPSFTCWEAFELSATNRLMLFIPPGIAHGFQTLSDNSELFYQMSQFYHPANARGVRWNDPAFAISWPLPVSNISIKDNNYPNFDLPQPSTER